MNASGPLPRALSWVALIFLLGGIGSLITQVLSVLNHHLQLDFGFLGIFVAGGLLRLSKGWRNCAIILLWLSLIMIPMVALLSFTAPHVNLNFFGLAGPEISPFVALLASIFWFSVALWQLNVLQRPDIVALFTD